MIMVLQPCVLTSSSVVHVSACTGQPESWPASVGTSSTRDRVGRMAPEHWIFLILSGNSSVAEQDVHLDVIMRCGSVRFDGGGAGAVPGSLCMMIHISSRGVSAPAPTANDSFAMPATRPVRYKSFMIGRKTPNTATGEVNRLNASHVSHPLPA